MGFFFKSRQIKCLEADALLANTVKQTKNVLKTEHVTLFFFLLIVANVLERAPVKRERVL